MGSVLGTAMAGIGVTVAAAALLALLHVSGLAGGTPAPSLVLVATGGFLVGIFAFGYGVGKRTGY